MNIVLWIDCDYFLFVCVFALLEMLAVELLSPDIILFGWLGSKHQLTNCRITQLSRQGCRVRNALAQLPEAGTEAFTSFRQVETRNHYFFLHVIIFPFAMITPLNLKTSSSNKKFMQVAKDCTVTLVLGPFEQWHL